jgi:hypothetical protein
LVESAPAGLEAEELRDLGVADGAAVAADLSDAAIAASGNTSS